MINAKLEVGLYGPKLRSLKIIDLDEKPVGPISIIIKRVYSETYLREDGQTQIQEYSIDCSLCDDDQSWTVKLPTKPFQLCLGANEAIELKLVAKNFLKVWK